MLPAALIVERRRKGLDQRDEVWDGELHMVPPATATHQRLAFKIALALHPIAHRRGLEILPEVGVRDPARVWNDFRVPDVVVIDPSQASDAAVEGRAELVIEVLSPDDESRKKFDFYARRGVREVWIAEPRTRVIEVYALRGDRYEQVAPTNNIHAPALGIELLLGHGTLHVRDGDYVAEI